MLPGERAADPRRRYYVLPDFRADMIDTFDEDTTAYALRRVPLSLGADNPTTSGVAE
ncbi:MAG: hypothetical protein M3401_06670 [Actinomycetota bacterium]|nr:hypothetical protein [Actinomycetota bacterium]